MKLGTVIETKEAGSSINWQLKIFMTLCKELNIKNFTLNNGAKVLVDDDINWFNTISKFYTKSKR